MITPFKGVWSAAAVFLMVCVGKAGQPQDRPPFVFGVLADVQYADKNTAGARHYRTALPKLEECVADMNRRAPAFVIQLGDLVDGYSNDAVRSARDLDLVLSVYGRLAMPGYHVAGNHCLTVGSETLRRRLGLEKFYCTFTVPAAAGWRFVVLDGNDAGYGVMGKEQQEWFRSTLESASKQGEKVICFCHYALLKEAARHHRMANPEPVLAAMDETGCVAAWLAGHDHAGGYGLRNGVHHVTIKGMVESPLHNAYALMELHPDRIREIGFGDEPGRDLPLPPARSARN